METKCTVFTPNNDGINDVLHVRGKGIEFFRLQIFDRWGEKIFETSELNIGWDGTLNGQYLNSAVFAYILTGQFKNGEVFKEIGNISLVR